MNIFNSLGSNFDLFDALQVLGSFGGKAARRRLIAYLTEDCCGGRPELCGSSFTKPKAFCKEDCHE